MELVRSLIERLKDWAARYKAALSYAAAGNRLPPSRKVEWNDEMIGDLRQRPMDT
jgi:hypothetical protein